MKVNIYYGGRGLLDDPTSYVIDKMQEVQYIYPAPDDEGCGWDYFGNNGGMARDWRVYAAVSGCLLAIWG